MNCLLLFFFFFFDYNFIIIFLNCKILGEFVLDEFTGLSVDEIAGPEFFDNEPFPPVNPVECDSYLPFNDDDGQLNLTGVFPPELFSDDFTDSDFLFSHIDDFEKELGAINENDPESDVMVIILIF